MSKSPLSQCLLRKAAISECRASPLLRVRLSLPSFGVGFLPSFGARRLRRFACKERLRVLAEASDQGRAGELCSGMGSGEAFGGGYRGPKPMHEVEHQPCARHVVELRGYVQALRLRQHVHRSESVFAVGNFFPNLRQGKFSLTFTFPGRLHLSDGSHHILMHLALYLFSPPDISHFTTRNGLYLYPKWLILHCQVIMGFARHAKNVKSQKSKIACFRSVYCGKRILTFDI